MSDLVQWLRAQLDEDERIARAACKYASPEWHLDEEFGETVLWWPPEFRTPYEQDKHWRGQALDGHLAPHIAGHDPARVLREVEAKRRVLDRYTSAVRVLSTYAEPDESHIAAKEVVIVSWVLRCLASVYADRPGYQEAWRP